jgi:uncharacterized membrane protein YhiD involved in acid resistance
MIDFLFALLNFAIFAAIIVYLFIRSMPRLKQAIETEKAIETDLHDEHHAVILKQQRVEESTAAQEDECNRLFIKIDEWKKAVESSAVKKADDTARDQKVLEEKIARQSEQYMLEEMYKKLAPSVIAELESSLKVYYSDPKKAHDYVNQFVAGLKK